MSTTSMSIQQLSINTIRTLAMDAVEKAGSGHPGTPMALAPVTYTLFNEVLNYDPAAPQWPGRDRFVLSCGHASMLLYAAIHLAGVRHVDEHGRVTDEPSLPIEQLQQFRQWQSRTPGHPEYRYTTGVETTTGPLGQGCGNSVGMAIAQRWLAARYNRPGLSLFDYNVYVMCSDGDLMEGVGCEAASIAGHLKLSNLCWIYDDNKITIEGHTDLAFTEDVPTRFRGLGWNVVEVDDANDLDALRRAIDRFHSYDDAPTLIVVRSIIAYGAPNKANTHGAHGAPLGEVEVRATKSVYGWPEDAQFYVPDEVRTHFAEGIGARGRQRREAWDATWSEYQKQHPDAATELSTMWRGELPEGWDADLPVFETDAKGLATRASSGKALNAIAKHVPWLIGGSADLAPSTNTTLTFDGAGDFEPGNYGGRNFHFGVREHGMASLVNGMALSGIRPYGATFFVFSDYLRPSMRLSAIMEIPSVFVFTHDSIGVGEDGPTHQPVEHLAAARAIPHLVVLRPGDANEASQAWRTILTLKDQPAALVLTRQALPTLDRSKYGSAEGVSCGAYVLADAPGGEPEVIIIGTGSELALCTVAHEKLVEEGIRSRLVSMPSWELFDRQDEKYRQSVFPPSVTARVAVEAGIVQGWERYLGAGGRFIGMDRFGASAPFKDVYRHLGFTPERVVATAKELLGR
ncbi:MAG: transketolase [Pirellulales bacterium]